MFKYKKRKLDGALKESETEIMILKELESTAKNLVTAVKERNKLCSNNTGRSTRNSLLLSCSFV